MSDQRTGVTAAGHRVLDVLDAGRAGWAQLSADGIERKIEIEIAAMVSGAAAPTPERLAALVIYSMERAAA